MDELDPTPAQLEALSADRFGDPVVMLNLVKYAELSADGDGTGKDAYIRYSRGFIPLLKRCGGTILWGGDVTGVAIGHDTGDQWDYAVLVWYPNRRAFVTTLTSPEYDAISVHRHNGLTKHVILPVSETYSKLGPSASSQ